jgi:hypothetical protein
MKKRHEIYAIALAMTFIIGGGSLVLENTVHAQLATSPMTMPATTITSTNFLSMIARYSRSQAPMNPAPTAPWPARGTNNGY